MQKKFLSILPGDGVGPEIISECKKVLNALTEKMKINLEITEFPYGADYFIKTGITIPADFISELEKRYDAVLLGPLGDPRIPNMKHAKGIISGLRKGLKLKLSAQKVTLYEKWMCPVTNIRGTNIDFLIIKDFFDSEKGGCIFNSGGDDEVAVQSAVYTWSQVSKFMRKAALFLKESGKTQICLVDYNFHEHTQRIWRRAFSEIIEKDEFFTTSISSVNAAAHSILTNPSKYDAIITNNLYGDFLANLGFFIMGGYGLATLSDIDPEGMGLFRIMHNSSPKMAGHNTSDPFGGFLALLQILNFLKLRDAASILEKAIHGTLKEHWTPIDLGGIVSTSQTGDYVVDKIKQL